MTLKHLATLIFLVGLSMTSHAQKLLNVSISEDDLFLLEAVLNRTPIASSVDAFSMGDRTLIAVEPLFDSLKVRYQLTDRQLIVWKDEVKHTIELSPEPFVFQKDNPKVDSRIALWGNDGFYQFIDLSVIEDIFGVKTTVDLPALEVIVQTSINDLSMPTDLKKASNHVFLFPKQKIAMLNQQRAYQRIPNALTEDRTLVRPKITIEDEYQLITPPNGRINFSADLKEKAFIGSAQLVSDLFYHSANLTLSKTDQNDLSASLRFNRYKSSPEKRILGLFDSYSFGDVTGVANNLTTSSNSGVGAVFQRSPDQYRRKNLEITLDELAPPGWDAELFHNGRFIDKTEVPDNGRLVYENQRLFYGQNIFEIRLYGPYGEEEIISKKVRVKQNPLGEGQLAYNLNVLDKNHRLFNDDNSENKYKFNNYGASLNYGVTDQWQLGFSFAAIDGEQSFFSVKNDLSFSNFLLENDLSFNQEGNYAQLTTITGSLFENDNYYFIFESADDFQSNRINALGNKHTRYAANYVLPTEMLFTSFGAEYVKDNNNETLRLTNILSKNIGGVSFSHNLTYYQPDISNDNQDISFEDDYTGSLGISGKLSDFYISGFINYSPERSDPILKSSSISVKTKLKDPYDNNHYLQAKIYPLNDSGQRWQLRHNVAWQSDSYQFTFASSYDSRDDWNVRFGIQFFLGYDYHQNKFIMDKDLQVGNATLDVHTYLDRQANGEPDVLDYNLSDVNFSGHPRWKKFSSDKSGRTILPGVPANSEFAFSARWQEGSATLNNDYVVYSHPGAYVDVNMPFYLITDLSGFVVRQQGGIEIPLRNVAVQLLDAENNVIKKFETDADGYYEFLNLSPDEYTVQVSEDYMQNKGLTGDVVAINVATKGKGGFVELPSITLRRVNSNSDIAEKGEMNFYIDDNNVDALVWSENEQENKNYFTLPSKGKVKAKHSLTQNGPQEVIAQQVENKPLSPSKDKSSHTKAKEFGVSNVLDKLEQNSSVLPSLNIVPGQIKVSKELSDIDQYKDKPAPLTNTKVENSVEQETVMNTGQWIIQFEANGALVNSQKAVDKYKAIGELFIGVKQASGKQLFCILSQSFSSKKEAIDLLNTSGLNGWVTLSDKYSNLQSIRF